MVKDHLKYLMQKLGPLHCAKVLGASKKSLYRWKSGTKRNTRTAERIEELFEVIRFHSENTKA